jgi:nitroreductase
MKTNQTIQTLLAHKSIRTYTEEQPSDEIITTLVKAGQQAAFAYQAYSVLLSRDRKKNTFNAPLLFTICVDSHKFELIMAKRNWKRVTNDLSFLLLAIQDACYMAQNMVVAAESLGLGTCFLGYPIYTADKIVKEYNLPEKVFPLVALAVGYPAQDPPPRPRYPVDFVLFEGRYPDFDDKTITCAIKVMDEGYLAQDYYKKNNYMIPLQDREEEYTFDDYSWTEHICRKLGQWSSLLKEQIDQLEACGFTLKDKE